jgi:hypothetical protein
MAEVCPQEVLAYRQMRAREEMEFAHLSAEARARLIMPVEQTM